MFIYVHAHLDDPGRVNKNSKGIPSAGGGTSLVMAVSFRAERFRNGTSRPQHSSQGLSAHITLSPRSKMCRENGQANRDKRVFIHL